MRYYSVDAALTTELIDFAWVSCKYFKGHGSHLYGILSRNGRVFNVYVATTLLSDKRVRYVAAVVDSVTKAHIVDITAIPDKDVYYTAELAARDALAIACDAILVVTAQTDPLTPPLF